MVVVAAAAIGELLLSKNSIHNTLPIIKDSGVPTRAGDDKFTHRRDEHQHGAGDDAVLRQGPGDAEQTPATACSQISSGFQQAAVQASPDWNAEGRIMNGG